MNKYPLKLKAVNKDIIWGGEKLGKFYGKGEGKIAEAWELTVHPEGVNVIENGEYAGMTLAEYLGSDKDFPVMIKLIDACDRLSVQVHPVKTEMWYVLEAEEGAALVYGLKEPFSAQRMEDAIKSNSLETLLNYVPVKKGDIFFIPQGLVHAIGKGILIAEIQENSNVTYRIYDYGRLQNGKPRELHVEQSLVTVKDFTAEQIDAIRYSCGRDSEDVIASCPLFKVRRLVLDGSTVLTAEKGFVSVVCVDGEGYVGSEKMTKGDSFFIPEGCPAVTVEGRCEILVTTA